MKSSEYVTSPNRRFSRRTLGPLIAGIFLTAGSLRSEAADRSERPRSAGIRLRVLSYNIHHAEGVDGKLDVERIASVIRSSEADVVAVQEVDRGVARSKRIDEPSELARLTKLEHFAFGKTIDHEGGDYGNLVLSRFPIASSKVHLLPNSAGAEQRGAVEAEIAPPHGPAFRLFATHLDFGRREASEADRQAAIRIVNERVDATRQPAIFAGDFNCQPDSRTVATIRESWLQSNSGDAFTTPVDKPRRQIDFIFLRPETRWKVIDVKVLDEAIASDHRPILATVELVPGVADR